MLQPEAAISAALPPQEPPISGGAVSSSAEAPPKQVALAMDRLGRAGRLIADIRLGADRLLEALFFAAESPHNSRRAAQFVLKEETSMRKHFHDLRALGRQLEESGVLNGSLKSRGNSWGLHMPLVCPDGAVVAYAWKRQLAGQAGASAVDRTRLALKAFTDQKRRFFPHLEDDLQSCRHDSESGTAKKQCISQGLTVDNKDELVGEKTLSDILKNLEHEAPNIKVLMYQRLDWLKRASSLSSSIGENSDDPSKEQSLQNLSKQVSGSHASAVDQVAVIELSAPSIFRAILSLHPAGSTNPDAVAFFSPNEAGSYIHARGLSVHHVFRHITEHADRALQYFLGVDPNNSLSLLLNWICSYQTLFTKVCSKCGCLLMMDKSLAVLLPPVHRSYQLTLSTKFGSTQLAPSAKGQNPDLILAYHIGCSSAEV
ncbi:mediator of RNA polymerase II transcription subunit 27 isoform X1 [Typha angustifolia]|uniref:mediator of RNA polymerase II transcription subunit 27 isoform X1 n=1 Tax=Typha angustifolia TaxID=59011 RepID=UPI003C2D771C